MQTMTVDLDYRNKVVLAPMVRVGTLPMRLMALEYGADLVYTEETIDKKLIGCNRIVNEQLGTVDFVKGSTVVFRTCAAERDRVVLQIGTADPNLALEAASLVAHDVAAIDINMGCPKHFSMSGGMGASLLKNPLKVQDIMTTLSRNLTVPVTCKIRLLDTVADTVELCRRIETTNARALAIHARRTQERPRDAAHWDELGEVIRCVHHVAVIANGDVWSLSDAERIRKETGAASVMLARGAQNNPSVFRADGALAMDTVIDTYVRKCVETDMVYQNTKYVLGHMMKMAGTSATPAAQRVARSRSLADICKVFDLDEFYADVTRKLRAGRNICPEQEECLDIDTGAAPRSDDTSANKRQRTSGDLSPPPR